MNPNQHGGDPYNSDYDDELDLTPLAAHMPPGPGHHYSDVAEPSVPNVYLPEAAVYAPQASSFFSRSGFNYPPQASSATVFNAPGHNSNPPHASVYQPGAPLYAQPGAANNDPHTSAGMVAPPASSANQGASRGPVAGDPNRSRLALQRFRANELLDAVQDALTPGDLEAIVNQVIRQQDNADRAPLMEVAESISGEIALKELVRLAALDLGPEAVQRLFRCLVNGWIMEQRNGPDLLQHFFTTFGYHDCSIFVLELAIPRFRDMLTSRTGSMSLMRCVEIAVNTEQGTSLQDTIVTQTLQIASSETGAFFLRSVFEKASYNQLEERIRERVLDNLVELSTGRFRNFVVQACFVPSHRVPLPLVPLLQRGLQAFSNLPNEQLRELVHNHRAGYVLRLLLRTSIDRAVAQEEAMQLAEKILTVRRVDRRLGDPRSQAMAILKDLLRRMMP